VSLGVKAETPRIVARRSKSEGDVSIKIKALLAKVEAWRIRKWRKALGEKGEVRIGESRQ
jgi:hypothetical protein